MVDKSTGASGYQVRRIGNSGRVTPKRRNQSISSAPTGGFAHKIRSMKQAAAPACEQCHSHNPQQPRVLESGKPFETYFHQLSHALRTPLNHINGFAEILLLNNDLDENQADYVRCILQASNDLQTAVLTHLDQVGEA